MGKIIFRYFFDFLDGQEKWLNDMAKKGYRLKKCGKITYTFEECKPSEYEYAVEYVGDKAYSKAKDYRKYLEEMGFRTFTKNINLNFSYGKVRWRPYAKGMGQIATSPGGFNKEILILEKKREGEPFRLHTEIQDKISVYKEVRLAFLWAILMMAILGGITFIPNISSLPLAAIWVIRAVIAAFAFFYIIPMVRYSSLIKYLKEEGNVFE